MSTPNPATVVVESTPKVQGPKEFVPNFGNGRYSKAGFEFFKDLQRLFKFTPELASEIAHHLMREAGNHLKNIEVNLAVTGKPSKDNELTLKELDAKVKIVATGPIQLMRLVSYMNDAMKYGLKPNQCHYVFSDLLQEYIVKMTPASK